MNPYLQIAREHLTVEELEMLLAEKKNPSPNKRRRCRRKKGITWNILTTIFKQKVMLPETIHYDDGNYKETRNTFWKQKSR